MAKKEQEELKPVTLKVDKSHVATPHGIELRRKGSKLVADARTQDFASTETIGAKTIESVIRECGATPPVDDEVMIISFSPHTGEVIGVAKEGEKSEEKDEEKADDAAA